jgi:ADP-heptose:LPS heptosyltransferase
MDVQMKSGQRLTFEPRTKALSQAIKNAKTDRELANALVAMSRFRISSGQHSGARTAIERAYSLDPKNSNVLHHYGLSQMRYGGILVGIKNYDAGRWAIKEHVEKYYRPFKIPVWKGQNLKGKSILIWAEQGIGDQVMHARSIPNLQAMGATISIECDPRLKDFFSDNFDDITYYPQGLKIDKSLNAKGFDYHCSLFSAWRWAKPQDRPQKFMTSDPVNVEQFKNAMIKRGHKFNIGLSWASAAKANGSTRSIALEQLRSLLETSGASFHSLQYDVSASDLFRTRHSDKLPIHTLPKLDTRNDIRNLAAAISAMDLIISVDNSTVHFAGALGVPTWAMLPKSSEWRWGQDGSQSELYKSVKLYRNKQAGNWRETLSDVSADLQKLIKKSARQ